MHIISKQSKSKCIKQGTCSRTHEKLNRTQLYCVNMREVDSVWNQAFMTFSEKMPEQKLSLSQIEGKVTSVRPFPSLRKEFNLIVGCFCVMRSTLLHLWGQAMDYTLGTRSLKYIVPFSCWTYASSCEYILAQKWNCLGIKHSIQQQPCHFFSDYPCYVSFWTDIRMRHVEHIKHIKQTYLHNNNESIN